MSSCTATAYAGCTTCFTGYDLDLEHYVDLGYIVRYPDLPKTRIIERTNIVRDKFADTLNLTLNYSNQVSDWISSADECKGVSNGSLTGTDISSQCAHSLTHLEGLPFLNNAVNNAGAGTATQSKIFWTGHILYESGARVPSFSYATQNSIVMTPVGFIDADGNNLSQSDLELNGIRGIMHELSHQIGASDEYCYNGQQQGSCGNNNCWYHNKRQTAPNPPDCIMYVSKNIAQTGTQALYCTFSLNELKTHLDNHH